MNKRYIDFVPKEARQGAQGSATAVSEGTVRVARGRVRAPKPEVRMPEPEVRMASKPEIRMPDEDVVPVRRKIVRRVVRTETRPVVTEVAAPENVARAMKPTTVKVAAVRQGSPKMAPRKIKRQGPTGQNLAQPVRRAGARTATQNMAQPGGQNNLRQGPQGVARPVVRNTAQQMRRPITEDLQRSASRQTPSLAPQLDDEQGRMEEAEMEALARELLAEEKTPRRRKMTDLLRRRQETKTEKKQVSAADGPMTNAEARSGQGRYLPAQREVTEVGLEANLLNDPLERPISEFADLEQLAQEIEEVTRGGAVVEEETQFVAAEASFSLKQAPQLGVVEDFQPRFLNTEVEKRPLSVVTEIRENGVPAQETGRGTRGFGRRSAVSGANRAETGVEDALRQAKAQKVRARKIVQPIAQPTTQPVEKPVENFLQGGIYSGKTKGKTAKTPKMQIPKTQFINQNKVAKRPLSKTVYQSGASLGESPKVATVKKPVKVAKEKKKGGTAGMVLAIIGTVILGAVVGTVAFLLLPR